jgi:hypothetical protein
VNAITAPLDAPYAARPGTPTSPATDRATAWPIPDPPPVTTAILPANSMRRNMIPEANSYLVGRITA